MSSTSRAALWRVFCYHEVDADCAKSFARQLDALRKMGFVLRSFSDAFDAVSALNVGRLASVTFDDGDLTVCNVAQPILDERGIKAMLYVTTGFVLSGQRYGTPPRPAVSWDHLGRWLEAGHEVGGHTHSHPPMSASPPAEQEDELQRSSDIMHKYLGSVPRHFAYPHGQYDGATEQVIRAQGTWRSAATIDRGWNTSHTNPFQLHRDNLKPVWGASRLRAYLALGACSRVYRLQRRLRGLIVPR